MYTQIVKARSALLVFLTHTLALPVLKMIRKPTIFPYTTDMLKQLPVGTLGNDLVQYLEDGSLKLLTHYVKHDMKHIILGYSTTDKGEVCLQCFMLGNRHFSFPVIATVLYGFITMPEFWKSFGEAFIRGRKTISIEGWKWFELVPVQTKELQFKLSPLK